MAKSKAQKAKEAKEAKAAEEKKIADQKIIDDQAAADKKEADEKEAADQKIIDDQAAADKKEADEEQAAKDKEASETVTATSRHAMFFEQYVEYLGSGAIANSIMALNNCFKHMLRHEEEEVFEEMLQAYKAKKAFLSPSTILQGVANLSLKDRSIVETIVTLFHLLVTSKDPKVSIDHIRSIVKNEKFVNWVAKKLA